MSAALALVEPETADPANVVRLADYRRRKLRAARRLPTGTSHPEPKLTSEPGLYRYTAFGETYTTDPKYPAPTGVNALPVRWKGRWLAYSTGSGASEVDLYDMRARWWCPQLGVFVQVDGFEFHDSKSTLWGWPGQNPYRYSDPTGHDGGVIAIGAWIAGGGELAGAAAALPFAAIAAGGLAGKAAIDSYFANLAAEQGTIHWQEETPSVPDTPFTDATGKVHGDEDLPEVVPDAWTGDDIEHAIDELIKSIDRRNEEQRRLGEEGGHRERIRREEEFLRKLRRKLENPGGQTPAIGDGDDEGVCR